MTFLHTMLRVRDLDLALRFWTGGLDFVESRRSVHEGGRFTLVFLRARADAERPGAPEIELTWNWDQAEPYTEGRNFGHIAVAVDDIYAACARLQAQGVTILRPPPGRSHGLRPEPRRPVRGAPPARRGAGAGGALGQPAE